MLYTSACFSIIAEGILNCSVSLNLAQTYLELSSLIGTVVYLTGWAKDEKEDHSSKHWQVDQRSQGPEVDDIWAS